MGGARCEVKFDQIRPLGASSSQMRRGATGSQASVANVPSLKRGAVSGKEVVTPGGYILPESYLIKAEDPEDVKKTKQRKIQQVKQVQREEKADIEAVQKANSWQSFKMTGKTKGGFGGGRFGGGPTSSSRGP